MLSNSYIAQSIPAELWDRYSEMEIEMILALAALSRRIDYTALTQADRMKALSELREELSAISSEYMPGTLKTLSKTMKGAAEKHLADAEKIFLAGVAAGILYKAPDIADSQVMNQALGKSYKEIANRLYRLNTAAVNVPLAVLDDAFMTAQSGAVSLEASVWGAVSELAERGIAVAMYPGGRAMELSAYVRMVVRTSVMQSTAELGFLRMAEYGCDLLVVSAHAGARPLCAPYQGKVFSLSGKHPKFPPWSSTSYGEPAGLLGINCGHFVDPWIEGLDRVPTREERDPAEAELGISNAQVYEESQEQRYIERKVRGWKRREAAMEEAELDSRRAGLKVREWQGRMRGFIEDTGRTRRYDREKAA